MNKRNSDQVEVSPLRTFHRPHNRAATAYTGQLVNHVTGEIYTPPERTKQSFVAECDINNILKQFKATGMINHVKQAAALGTYVDLPEVDDFQASLNSVMRAEQAFASLPSKLRARFDNDPATFLEFFQDPKNQDEAIKLGLAQDTRPPTTLINPQNPPATPPSTSPSTSTPKTT